MAWNYAYQVDSQALSDYCTSVRIVSEFAAAKRGSNPAVPYIHGEYSEPRKWTQAGLFGLDCVLRYTNASGAVTHTDGAAGHAYENLAELKQRLYGAGSLVTLKRTTPHQGVNEGLVEVLDGIQAAGPRLRFVFPCRLVEGSWRETPAEQKVETAITTSRAFTLNVGGNHPVGDAVLTIEAVADVTDAKVALDVQNDFLQVNGTISAGETVVIDCGARTVLRDSVRDDAALKINRGWWMEFPADTAALAATATAASGTDWDLTIDWFNRWR